MTKKILVIDDEVAIRILLKKMLEKAGYEVVEASNGKIGLDLYDNNIDLVITDIIMPEKEGMETIRELKQKNPEIKIIAISGGGTVGPDEYLFLAERFGVNKTLSKPFTMEEILEAVKGLTE